jgi:hypothetical protein
MLQPIIRFFDQTTQQRQALERLAFQPSEIAYLQNMPKRFVMWIIRKKISRNQWHESVVNCYRVIHEYITIHTSNHCYNLQAEEWLDYLQVFYQKHYHSIALINDAQNQLALLLRLSCFIEFHKTVVDHNKYGMMTIFLFLLEKLE